MEHSWFRTKDSSPSLSVCWCHKQVPCSGSSSPCWVLVALESHVTLECRCPAFQHHGLPEKKAWVFSMARFLRNARPRSSGDSWRSTGEGQNIAARRLPWGRASRRPTGVDLEHHNIGQGGPPFTGISFLFYVTSNEKPYSVFLSMRWP